MINIPLFSLIIPVFNIDKFLNRCLNSILEQTFSNLEIILVDDGSTDSCPQICDDYAEKDSRIKIIHKPNGGPVSARKAGVTVASGEYIACVDGDDWISIKYFAKFAEIIDKYHPDIICCGAIWAYEDKEIWKEVGVKTGYYNSVMIEKEIFPILLERDDGKYFSPSVWAKIFKREIFQQQQIQVDNIIKMGEDIACVKPCIFHSKSIYILDDCLYYYRQHSESLTKKRTSYDINGPRLIGQHLEKMIDNTKYDFRTQINRLIVHNLFIVCSSQFNNDLPYKKIKDKIVSSINDAYYKTAINECAYHRYIKGECARIILKNQYIFILWIYNKVKSRL